MREIAQGVRIVRGEAERVLRGDMGNVGRAEPAVGARQAVAPLPLLADDLDGLRPEAVREWLGARRRGKLVAKAEVPTPTEGQPA